MKKWLVERFLPMWAKETVLAENQQLKKEVEKLNQALDRIGSYVRGLENGIRTGKRVQIYTGGKE